MKMLLVILIIQSRLCYAELSQTDTLNTKYADSLISLAHSIYYSNPDSSYYFSSLALNYALTNQQDIQAGKAMHSLAKTEVLRGDIELALNHLKSAAIIFEKSNQPLYEAKCYALMSTAVSKIDNDKECIRLLLKAGNIYRSLNAKDELDNTLFNLANAYAGIGEFDKAFVALDETKANLKPGSTQWFYYYINAGLIYRGKKNYPLAKVQFDSCLAISKRNKMVDAEVTALTQIAYVYLNTSQFEDARTWFNKAIDMSRINTLPLEESDALKGLMNCYETTGDYRNAFICQNRLKVISDSLFNIEKIKNINTVETKLKVSEKEKTIALQNLAMEKSATEQAKSKKRIWMLIAGTSVLAVILFFTLYIYTRVRRQKKEVEIQKARAERLNSLNQKIFAVIAHDFKSPLITLNMLIDLMDKENISKEDMSLYSADVRNQITQSSQILDNLLNWAKTELNLSQTSNLKSSPFQVAAEVIKELNYMSSRKNIRVINEIPETLLLKVPPDILKIITRNLLSNAVKFSFSDSIVTIGSEPGDLLFVKDNGAGINDKTINNLFNGTVQSRLGTFNETGFGLGLYITHELINKFMGKIFVEKNQPGGTLFKFSFTSYE